MGEIFERVFCLFQVFCWFVCLSFLSLCVPSCAPLRCVKSAQTFVLALLMWQFGGCDYVGCRVVRWVQEPGFHACEINETKKGLFAQFLQRVRVFMLKLNTAIDPSAESFEFHHKVCQFSVSLIFFKILIKLHEHHL